MADYSRESIEGKGDRKGQYGNLKNVGSEWVADRDLAGRGSESPARIKDAIVGLAI